MRVDFVDCAFQLRGGVVSFDSLIELKEGKKKLAKSAAIWR